MNNQEPIDDQIVSSHELAKSLEGKPKIVLYKSGNAFLDKLIGGWARGDMVVLGGKPGVGKTNLIQTWTKQFASQNFNCLWFTIELSNQEFIGRFGDKLPLFYIPKEVPLISTLNWIEKKTLETVEKLATEGKTLDFVFVDHLTMIMDEKDVAQRNSVDILDARLFRMKQFAMIHKYCLVLVAPTQQESNKTIKGKIEPTEGSFRGTAMIASTASSLLFLDRVDRGGTATVVNEAYDNEEVMESQLLVGSDAYLYILKSRRTGVKKVKIKMYQNEEGDIIEAI